MEKSWSRFLYPRCSWATFGKICLSSLAGALIAGLYGVLHDEVTYSLSTEYFTRFKFIQFAYADVGLPPRGFIAVIGFLATWWVGAIAGWFLGRLAGRLLSVQKLAQAFALLILTTFLGGVFGAVFHEMTYESSSPLWQIYEDHYGVENLRAFARVGQIHKFGYLGALVGLVIAALKIRRQAKAQASD